MRNRFAVAIAAFALGAQSLTLTGAEDRPAASAQPGKSISDRTMEDIKQAEAALAEQVKNEHDAIMKRVEGGTYTDPGGYVFKWGLVRPAKEQPGVKYPLFVGGDVKRAFIVSASQAEYPCYAMSCWLPDPKLRDWRYASAAAFKAVVDKAIAKHPNLDASRVWVSGCSKYAGVAYYAAYNYPDTFAATVVSGMWYEVCKSRLIASRGIGIWFLQGLKDGVSAPTLYRADGPLHRIYGNGAYSHKILRADGFAPLYTEYTYGTHHELGYTDSLKKPEWNDFAKLKKWLFAQKKPTMDWPVINSPSTAVAVAGKPFSYTITASNAPKSFGAVSTFTREQVDPKTNLPTEPLPEDLTFDSEKGIISGAPRKAGRFYIMLTATNDKGTGATTLFLAVKDK